MNKNIDKSRRKFIGKSAKALTGMSVASMNLPFLLFNEKRLLQPTKENNTNSEIHAGKLNADEVAKAFSELTIDTSPEKLYTLFNQFCLTHFGAETDPLMYEVLGNELKIEEGSRWNYFSERSAVIAWSTTLPSKTYVEFGPGKSYGRKTEFPERYYYTHLHYLKNLEPDTLYHYRIISKDERGNITESADETFRIKTIPEAIHIPGDQGFPPYILDKPNAVYLITENINAPGTAFNVEAHNITIDLGGNTVTHGNELISNLDYTQLLSSGSGIRKIGGGQLSGLKILNGILKQGIAENNLEYYAAEDMLRREPAERRKKLAKNMSRGFNNIEMANVGDVEIAGITAEHRWHQIWGMQFDKAFGTYNIHHNVFLDKGIQMFSRHGDGTVRSLGFRNPANDDSSSGSCNNIQIHHNLVKRARQNALNGAHRTFDNEIYIDSWVVNSFAISPCNYKGEVRNNKIFMTGYYGCGITWAVEELNVCDNFIHMESINTMINPPLEGRRLIETWGEQDVLIGMRLTNYGSGGQKRSNFTYNNNVIFGRSRGEVIMRGTALYSDYTVENFILKNNIIKILAEDTIVRKAACVVTQGANNNRSDHLPMYYIDSVLESNICNVRFGDEYGRGSNHRFVNCNIINTGDNPNYHTFVFDGGTSVFNHVFLDCNFFGGASYSDVYWNNTRSKSNYSINWTLKLETDSEAMVTITDKNGNEVFTGNSGDDGIISVPLVQSIIRPVEWNPDGKEVAVTIKSQYQEEQFNPYTVNVEKDGKQKSKTINLNQKSTINI